MCKCGSKRTTNATDKMRTEGIHNFDLKFHLSADQAVMQQNISRAILFYSDWPCNIFFLYSIRSLCHFKVQQEHLPFAPPPPSFRPLPGLGALPPLPAVFWDFATSAFLAFFSSLVFLIRSLISLSQEIFILSQDCVELFNDKSRNSSGLTPQLLLPEFRTMSNQGQNHTSHEIIKLQIK
jgi:hypothetical protein